MLENIDLSKKLKKHDYNVKFDELSIRLSELQRECRTLGIPVIVIFEGLGASGKGTLINQLIEPLDPRGFRVYAINGESSEEQLRPFLWRFWTKTPEKGKIAIFDRSWYRRVLIDRYERVTTKEQLTVAYQEINSFEQQIADSGAVILKFFLYIDKAEQEKRFKHLLASKETAWRVSEQDLKRNKQFDKYLKMNEEMLEKTDTDYAPWTIVEAMDKEFASVKILSAAVNRLAEAAAQKRAELKVSEKQTLNTIKELPEYSLSVLNHIDLNKSLTKEQYKEKLDKLQKKLALLHNEIYRRRIPVILAFEGWDAGGKGGAIKRLTQCLDPRGYAVNATAAPNDIEKAHHYLWRFWNEIPKAGHISIYDRTWYGRVMVERVEGFCTLEEWQRAYKEINQMERHLSNFGTVILKFWMHIDKDEQEKRFKERMENPAKQWKITDEDWRNREKWEQYEEAVDEMLVRTSTTYAPWIIVEANSKYYARIKVLETVIHALEERLR